MARSLGAVRKVDGLGRLIVPKSLRERYEMDCGAPVEFLAHEDGLLIRAYHPGCVFCGNTTEVKEHEGKRVCRSCASAILGRFDHEQTQDPKAPGGVFRSGREKG